MNLKIKNKNIAYGLGGIGFTLASLFNSAAVEARECSPDRHVLATGQASYYADQFHGRTTANGEKFNMYAMTAANKTLPFGTKLSVEYQGREVVVRINDRGPYVHGRIIDLSKGAAQALGLVQNGVGQVKLRLCK